MLKIANWNLERILPKQRRAERLKNEISKIEADILILTETHKNVGPEKFKSVTSIDREEGECWAAIWSTFPIAPLNDFVSDTERCTAAKVIHPQYGELIIYATVLPWVGSTWHNYTWNKGEAYMAALETYQKDWENLQLAYPDAMHIIVGDFNQSLVDFPYYGSKLIRSKLEEVIKECDMTIVTAGKNDPIARDSKPHACIDHICISTSKIKQITSTQRWPNKDKPDKKLSDHFGVIVEIECKVDKIFENNSEIKK